ncbi:adenylate/guanylate cyclase domain-containing protein [Nisaea acidiphila]|uniref:Adenylate/guanylate cyclase domain-containing protein n=1 Tax=Nisaea acidiphila TaxID=1862145 RepID=A0A9J7B0Y2_9PROT|nr:adenylate/guanylate cyclase domain-containing protein [Nisaea acidiphila]UUX51341.1 adenylate/guanylate cyclase domain-containing protein [Nisaea acidiphila]
MHENKPVTDPKAVEIIQWLVYQSWEKVPNEQLIAATAERLVEAGIPLDRCRVAMYTLHPEVGSLLFDWDRAGNLPETGRREEIAYTRDESEEWKASPLRHMMATGTLQMRRRLTGPGAQLDFQALVDFRDEGFTDYYACMFGGTEALRLIKEGERSCGAILRWSSRHPDGFSDRDIAFIDAIVPALTSAIQAHLDQEIAANLLSAYVGPLVGARILKGEIRRGMAESLNAVLMIADLSDFTSVSDIVSKEEMVSALNRYFDAMLEPVHAAGGQVLKFLGDGFLAIFPLSPGLEAETASHALEAAKAALAAVDELAETEADLERPAMGLNVALHLGEVMFGNVGSRNRLDFTVIGPAVNEASRMESLCRSLGTDIILSETIASLLPEETRLLTRMELRGVKGERALYAPAEPLQAAK